ncbi:MAG: tetratricopeptide repeat protein [Bryobacteraceae bacterium]
MSLDGGFVGPWLARGIEAYGQERFSHALELFEKAVAVDPESLPAHLAVGAAYLTLYRKRPSPPLPDVTSAGYEVWEREFRLHQDNANAILAEQNATSWPRAEKSLRTANRLDPDGPLVVEYLGALYYSWKDPLDESDRFDEAKRWLDRLLELYPEHKYANFYCGMILIAQAHKLLPDYGRFPPLREPDLPSLRLKVGPMLEEASRYFTRQLTVVREHTAASYFIDEITSMQAYLKDPEQAARELSAKLTESFRNHVQPRMAASESGGVAVADAQSETITFRLSPEALAEDRARPFPPNPWRL